MSDTHECVCVLIPVPPSSASSRCSAADRSCGRSYRSISSLLATHSPARNSAIWDIRTAESGRRVTEYDNSLQAGYETTTGVGRPTIPLRLHPRTDTPHKEFLCDPPHVVCTKDQNRGAGLCGTGHPNTQAGCTLGVMTGAVAVERTCAWPPCSPPLHLLSRSHLVSHLHLDPHLHQGSATRSGPDETRITLKVPGGHFRTLPDCPT